MHLPLGCSESVNYIPVCCLRVSAHVANILQVDWAGFEPAIPSVLDLIMAKPLCMNDTSVQSETYRLSTSPNGVRVYQFPDTPLWQRNCYLSLLHFYFSTLYLKSQHLFSNFISENIHV